MIPNAESKVEFPRTFVPVDADLGDWARIEPLFDALERTPCNGTAELLDSLLKASELAAAIGEEGSRRYIEMTCDTEDENKTKRYLHFVESIVPECRPRWNAIDRRLAGSPHFDDLPDERYLVLKRGIRNRVRLFRRENVPLEVEVAKLGQRYQKIIGAMTVEFDGREQTMQQMMRYLEETDRSLRRAAWEAMTKRRLADKEILEEIFDQMLALRHKIATNADFEDFRAYTFAAMERFDYTPQDCLRFHDAVKRYALPLLRMIQERRRTDLGLANLSPWDLAVDPKGRAPLRPFKEVKKLIDGVLAIFNKIDPQLAEGLSMMDRCGNLDLDSRKGKAPGGYQATLEEVRIPFIFMNAAGMQSDLSTLLHEGGHAFHALLARSEPLLAYRSAPLEFCEVASMGMELLAHPYLDEFYKNEQDLRRARREHLEKILNLFPWIATVDAFQHWIYTHPEQTPEQRKQAWRRIHSRFEGIVDWSGFEEAAEYLWHRQLHIFLSPFYYIEYGIAQLGALQVWQRAQDDRQAALADLKAALALGGSRPLPELFNRAGIRFDFSSETLEPLIKRVSRSLR